MVNQRSAKAPFIYGLQYAVRHRFQLSNDQESFFIKEDRVTFLHATITWMGRAEYGHTNLHFYNNVRGSVGILKYNQENDLNVFSKYNLALVGGWAHPVESNVSGGNLHAPEVNDPEKLIISFLPYFKSVVEGAEQTENWFYWMHRHSGVLHKLFSPMDLLQLKINSFDELKRILDEHHIDYKPGVRYAWLNRKRNYCADL